jgi:hypothetical protein
MSDRIGVLIRKLAGVDEEILAKVPQDRSRLTAISGTLLITTLVSTISMAAAINQVVSFSWLGALSVALWGVFALSLDRWIFASTATTSFWRRVQMFLPRLVLSLTLGVVMTEPLVLAIFRPAIDAHLEAQSETAGLLARMEALAELQVTSPYLHAAVWLLRLLLILLISLPTITTLISRPSAYDAAVAARLREVLVPRTRSRALVTERVAALPPEARS